MGQTHDDMMGLLDRYTQGLVGMVGGGPMSAATDWWEMPALVVRDEISWSYSEPSELGDDLQILADQGASVGVNGVDIEITDLEPLTSVLTSVDARLDFKVDDTVVLQTSWRYVVRETDDGPRLRAATLRDVPVG